MFDTPPAQSAEAELRLQEALMATGLRLSALPNTGLVNSQQLGEDSPPADRLAFRSDLLTGLPYSLPHADAVGQALARLIAPAPPKKGLITDLDDTLWHGILGEVGADQVAWDLTSHNQIHGLYQQLLSALGQQGILIAIASKNDPAVVDQALSRSDILLSRDHIFPIEAHWQSKSGSVDRILKIWNIAADSVVFVDDSPMELAEVEQAHPGIQCLRFPKDDYAGAVPFLRQLRSLFGRARASEEDVLRLQSIRQGAEFQKLAEQGASAPEAFLAGMQAQLQVDFEGAARDPRVLELVNKTNQFNLNGIRYGDVDWNRALEDPGAFVASIAYQDRFGRLGKIAAIRGRQDGCTLRIGSWVMSCRAFARRIEYQCLLLLFERFGGDAIQFEFTPTAKNGPLQEFFTSLMGEKMKAPFVLRRETFEARRPTLYHDVSGVDRPVRK
jgi:FkbH-like protein